jgi:hypothetical protein
MSGDLADLPPELGAKFLSFLREVNGEFEVADTQGLLLFVVEHGEQYPALFNMFEINMDVIVDHFERTGVLPPGVRLIRKSTREGTNITQLEVLHGPLPPKS